MTLLHDMNRQSVLQHAWDKLGAVHPSVWKTFLLLVLPFSLLPPVMLVYAGNHHAAQYLMDATPARWEITALVFFLAELMTVPLMAWVLKSIASVHNVAADFKDTFLLAAISALPMWLSAFGLGIPSLWFMIGLILLGLGCAANLLYQGSRRILNITDPIEAQSLAYQAFSVGGVVWVLLCAFVVLPLMT